MSPVFLVLVIHFVMSPVLDTAHAVWCSYFFFQTFSNSSSNCVGMDIFLTDISMHSFMGGVIVYTGSPLPPSHALVVIGPCQLFLVFGSGMAGGEMRLKFSWCCPVYFGLISGQT